MSKILKTFILLFVAVCISFISSCVTTGTNGPKLQTPDFRLTTEDNQVVVYIEEVPQATSYYFYIYQNEGLLSKYIVSTTDAIKGYKVTLNYGEYEACVQAQSSNVNYADSVLSAKQSFELIEPEAPAHVHVACPECGLCTAKNCTGEILERCLGHKPVEVISTITYVLNGGTLPNNAPTSYKEGTTTFLENPTKANSNFLGWYTKSDFSGEKVNIIANTTTGNITLYAKWESSNPEYTGYYAGANGLEDNALKLALRKIITAGFKTISYGDLRYKLQITDAALDDDSKILLLFSHHKVDKTWDGGNTWNREHVWPKSKAWYQEEGGGCDIHHIRPENPTVNSTHNNYPYGEVTGGKEVKCCGEVVAYLGGGYFEPLDEFKGDVARIIFYLLVRYAESDSYSITNVAQSLQMLLEWHESDPVCEFEIARNERSYTFQNNRNPFIDHPEFASMIWG